MAKNKNTVALKKGDRLTFKGYTSLDDSDEPLFEEGDILVVNKVVENEDGSLEAEVYREADGVSSTHETIFYPEEAELLVEDEAEAEEPVKEKSKAKVKEKAKPVQDAEEAEDAEEVVEEKAPAKAKAKTAVAKVKAAPARTEEEEEITHLKTVAKLLKKSDDILEAAKSLATQVEQTYFNLGGVLAEIHHTNAHVSAGYTGDKGFESYLKEELGMEYRKAMFLIKIYKAFSKLEVDEARLSEIGWTKVRMLSRYVDGLSQKELDTLLDNAEKLSREKLEKHIQKTFVGSKAGTGERATKVRYSFTVFDDQAEAVGASVARAQELVEGGDINLALRHIVLDWAMTAEGVNIPLADAIATMETRYGVKLSVNDSDSSDAEADEAEEVQEEAPVVTRGVKAKKGK